MKENRRSENKAATRISNNMRQMANNVAKIKARENEKSAKYGSEKSISEKSVIIAHEISGIKSIITA